MGVREVIDKRKKLTAVIWGLVIVAAAGIIFWEVLSTRRSGANHTFFTIDDGKTWFVGDLEQLPPFDYQGREAVRCFVYQSSSGKQFAGYLMKYTPQARASLEKASPEERERRISDMSLALFKRPGQANWLDGSDRGALEIMRSITGPSGESDVVPVYP